MGPVVPFEYISILVSIILGLGMTQLLSSFTDLLYNHRKVRFYWPQLAWVVFVLFLHIQDWLITFQLRTKTTWDLPDLFFVLLYPIALFCVAKLLLPTNEAEERRDMRVYFHSQFRMIAVLMLFCIGFSILFNFWYLEVTMLEQVPLFMFFAIMATLAVRDNCSHRLHQALAAGILVSSAIAVVVTREEWVVSVMLP